MTEIGFYFNVERQANGLRYDYIVNIRHKTNSQSERINLNEKKKQMKLHAIRKSTNKMLATAKPPFSEESSLDGCAKCTNTIVGRILMSMLASQGLIAISKAHTHSTGLVLLFVILKCACRLRFRFSTNVVNYKRHRNGH